MSEAGDGREALAEAETFGPDLIFMDLVMPNLSGYDATKQLQEMPGQKETKIIAISTGVFEEIRAQSLAAGCNDFLPKPFDVDNKTKNH